MEELFETSAIERLRWLVFREFNTLPGSVPLSDEDCLRCGVNMVLDRQAAGAQAHNPAFDEERFGKMKEGLS